MSDFMVEPPLESQNKCLPHHPHFYSSHSDTNGLGDRPSTKS